MTSIPTLPATLRASSPVMRTPRQEVGMAATGAMAIGALAVGAIAVGALALGALAVGRLAIGGLSLRTGHAKHLLIDDLTVVRLRIVEVMAVPAETLRSLYQRAEPGE